VYDEHGGQEFVLFERYLRRFPIVPFIGAGNARKRPVWAADVMDGLLRLAGNSESHGKLYNFSGPESISMRDFAHLILQKSGSDRPFLHLPVWLCSAVAFVLERCMKNPPLTRSAIAGIVNDADLDPTQAMRELGYRPLALREGFARCFPERAAENAALSPSLSRGNAS
jgi:NADH dehydrogenase